MSKNTTALPNENSNYTKTIIELNFESMSRNNAFKKKFGCRIFVLDSQFLFEGRNVELFVDQRFYRLETVSWRYLIKLLEIIVWRYLVYKISAVYDMFLLDMLSSNKNPCLQIE